MIHRRWRKITQFILLITIVVTRHSLASPSADLTAGAPDSPYYPSTVEELERVLSDWSTRHSDAFWALAANEFNAESRASDWASLMEDKIDESASSFQDMKFHGECRESLCRYYADYDAVMRPEDTIHKFGRLLVNNNTNSLTEPALSIDRPIGPHRIEIYIFRAELGAAYFEPMRQKFEHSRRG